MDTVQLAMTEGVKDYLQDQAAKSGLASPRDYLQAILDDLATRVQEKRELEASLLEAIRSPRVVADEAFWIERRRKILDKHPELK